MCQRNIFQISLNFYQIKSKNVDNYTGIHATVNYKKALSSPFGILKTLTFRVKLGQSNGMVLT
jgi:hypothetical protein